jgi:hypothetical protein
MIRPLGTNNRSDMFPAHNWTKAWMVSHCRRRFGVAKPGFSWMKEEMGLDAIERWPQPTRNQRPPRPAAPVAPERPHGCCLLPGCSGAGCAAIHTHRRRTGRCGRARGRARGGGGGGVAGIIFSNGEQDPWSAGGVVENISSNPSIVAITIPHGAHHQDLNGAIQQWRQWDRSSEDLAEIPLRFRICAIP